MKIDFAALAALGVTGIRGLALGLSLSGNGIAAARLEKIASGVESGADTDADMQAAADLLDAGKVSDADWAEVEQGIREESEEMRGN